MTETVFVVVVTVVTIINSWLVYVRADKKIDEVFENMRNLNERVLDLENQTIKLKNNPAILKANREDKIQSLKYELKKLEEERHNDYIEVDYDN